MQRCTYRTLEFAKSELEPKGVTFAVLLRFDDVREKFFRSFYLADWQAEFGTGYEDQVSYVEDMMYEFRQFAHRPFTDSEEAIEQASNLSVGPLRTGLTGTAALPLIATIHPELRDDLDAQVCSRSSFRALIQSIIENSEGVLYASDHHLSVEQA